MNESITTDLLDNVLKHLQDLGRMWKRKYPDEGVDTEYVAVTFDRDHYAIGFLQWADKRGQIIKGSKTVPKELKGQTRCQVHGCFYNSLDFMHRFGDRFPKVKLAYGISFDPRGYSEMKQAVRQDPEKEQLLQFSTGHHTTIHAFLVDGKKVIDPTMGRTKNFYYYETVPEKVWRKFNYKEDDPGWNAKQFADFIRRDIEKKQNKFPFAKMFNKIGGVN